MANAMDTTLASQFWPALKAIGFRRTGRTYRLGPKGHDQGLINLQGSSGSALGVSIFYVNLAVMPRIWVEFSAWMTNSVPKDDPDEVLGVLRNRLLAPIDVAARSRGDSLTGVPSQQWKFSDNEEAEHCGRLLTMLVARDVAPLLDELRDPVRLLDFVARPASERGVLRQIEPGPEVLTAVLLADSGPLERVDNALEKLRRQGIDRVVEWVEMRRSRR